jgi:hypothetical protein
LPKPRIVVCGGRGQTFKDFSRAAGEDEETALLLVDSEGPVSPGMKPSEHLRERDRWTAPANAVEDQIHLMVQSMETWLVADHGALENYYRKGFKREALPPNPRIEEVSKRDVIRALESAAARTSKKTYHKTRDGFELLSLIDPGAIRSKSPFAERFFATLADKIRLNQ